MRTISILPLVLLAAGCAVGAHDETTGTVSEAVTTGPDLQVTKVSGPASVAPGASFNVAVTVCNKGTDPIPGTRVDAVISPTGQIDLGHATVVGFADLGYLSAGVCADVTIPSSANGAQSGTFGAIVDPSNQTIETNENNNTRAGNLVGVGWGPDLVAKSIVGPTSAPYPMGTVGGTVDVCNQGTTPSNATSLTFVLSSDATITSADNAVATATVDGLNPGACENVSLGGAETVPAGVWYPGVILDPQNTVAELLEQNNTLAGKPFGIGNAPDLVVTAIAHPPDITLGSPYTSTPTVTATVCNQGTQPSAATSVDLRLSTDATITSADPLFGSASVASLGAGQCTSAPAYLEPPLPDLANGPYYLGGIVDPQNQIAELVETNNAFAGTIVGYGNGPDYVVTSVTGPAVITGSNANAFTAHVTVCNQGADVAASPRIGLFLSADNAITTADNEVGLVSAPYLAAGTCASVDIPGQSYLPNPSHQLYLGAIIDPDNSVPELLETNNAKAGPLVGVGDGPDFYVSAFTAPTDVAGPFNVTTTICNQGDFTTGVDFEIYMSPNKTIDPNDASTYQAGFGSIPSLAQGQCSPVTVQVNPLPFQNGQQYIQAIVDPQSEVPELLETNNGSAVRSIGVGNGPDLTIAITSVPAAAVDGQPFNTTIRVCNQGTAPSTDTDFRVFLSTDTTIATSDEPISPPQDVPALAAGKCVSFAESLSIFDPPATYYLGAIVTPLPTDPNGPPGGELISTNNTSAAKAIAVTAN